MKRITVSRNNNAKRTKLQRTTSDTNRYIFTQFENLPNEVFYEIFEFLDFHHVFEAFFELNIRFQNLLRFSMFPSKVNISSISKSTFQRYYTQIIIPYMHQINTLQLTNLCSINIALPLLPILSNFTRLQILTINHIESEYIENLLNSLLGLPDLSSLTIEAVDDVENPNNLYRQIFRLRALKYCQVLFEKKWIPVPLPFATNQFSSIEHFVIKNNFSFNQFDSFLSYIPRVRRLSFQSVEGFYDTRIRLTPVVLKYLTHLSIRLYSIVFNQFKSLIRDFFRHVQVLSVLVDYKGFTNDTQFLQADRWERLLTSHMPHLHIFDFQHHRITLNTSIVPAYEQLIDKFTSAFWIERQWHFAHQYRQEDHFTVVIFSSTNPYRGKYYTLYDQQICSRHTETNINSVGHVCIYNESAMSDCQNYFPNTSELTLLHKFDALQYSTATSLARIIPLRKLNKLVIDCYRFSCAQLVELLSLTPNIHTLKLNSICLDRTDVTSLQSSETFQLVSNTNTVTNVIIVEECTLEQTQVLVALFPQLEHLTIELYNQDLEATLRFLLFNVNSNTSRLFSVCLSNATENLKDKLQILIESKRLVDHYIIKVVGHRLYLWW